MREYNREYRRRRKAQGLSWPSEDDRYWRKIEREYGLTREQYESLLAEQESRCAVCRQERPLVVDHCHDSGCVRGLLCQDCNKGLGSFKDDPDVLRAATQYVEDAAVRR